MTITNEKTYFAKRLADEKLREARDELDTAYDWQLLVMEKLRAVEGKPAEQAAAMTELVQKSGMPKSLILKLKTDRIGYLHDCVLWMRRLEKKRAAAIK